MALELASEFAWRCNQKRVGRRGKSKEDALREQAMSGNIRESAIGEIGEGAKIILGCCADVIIKVGGYCGCLVCRAREIVAEASGASGPGDLGFNGLSTADCGNVGTCGWELRRKLWCHLAVIGLTRSTDSYGVR